MAIERLVKSRWGLSPLSEARTPIPETVMPVRETMTPASEALRRILRR